MRFKKQAYFTQNLVFIIVPHINGSTKLENYSKRSFRSDLQTSHIQFLHQNLIQSNIDFKNENLSRKMSIVELLDTFHPSVVICFRKRYTKNARKSCIVVSLVQQKFLRPTYFNFQEIFDVPLVFFTSFSISQHNIFSQKRSFPIMQFSKTNQRGFLQEPPHLNMRTKIL